MSTMNYLQLSLKYLRGLKPLCIGQADSLLIDDGTYRVWLSRCRTEDGEPFNNAVTVEQLDDKGRWKEVAKYPAL